METYKIYKITFDDGLVKKTYFVASTCIEKAFEVAIDSELYHGPYISLPIDFDESDEVEGLYARTSGIKCIIY